MIYDPYPLSIYERKCRVEALRQEAAAKNAEADRIEEGIKADEAEMVAMIEKVINNKGRAE